MREIVSKIYTFLVKAEDADFVAWRDFLRPQTYKWDKPKRVWVWYGKRKLLK